MNSEILFSIIVTLVIANQLFSYLLDYLNISYRNQALPPELEDVYDKQQYQKQQAYEIERTRFSFWASLLSVSSILIMLFFDGFAFLDNFLREFTSNEITISLSFFGILLFASNILSLPFSIYSTFVIEQKYGFNKTTVKTFLLDMIKGAFLSLIIGGTLLYLIILFYQLLGTNFWIVAWGLITVFMLFMNMFYSQLIVPLFNKQTLLEQGSLRMAIEAFSKKVDFKLNNIFVIDGSKRSSKANAYFSGLGSQKRIVLYDTLINDLKEEEIVAVLAHEVGHYKHKHTKKGMLRSVLQIGLILFLFSLLIDNPMLNQALGSSHQTFHFGMLVFSFLFEPFSLMIGIVSNYISRQNEYQADAFAQKYGLDKALITGLKQLSRNNLSNLTPHPFYVFIYYSHPTIYQRIKALEIKNVNNFSAP